jgi:predicted PurR-regulated permease PerM
MNRSYLDQVSIALSWASLAVLVYLVYLVVQPFLAPLAWAAVLAVLTYPLQARLAVRWGRGWSAAFTTVIAAVVIIVPAVALTFAFVRETLEISSSLQNAFTEDRFAWIERAWAALQGRFPAASNVDLGAVGSSALRQGATFLMTQSGSIFRNVAGFLVDLALALFATFFFLRDAGPIMNGVRRLLPMREAAREELLGRTRDLISAGVTSAGLVAGLQGLLGGIAFVAVGIGAPVFWGVVMAFFCLLPFGAWIIWLPAAVVLAAGGAVTRALVLAGLGLGIVSMVDNVVRPMLLSGRAHMNGLVIVVSLLGGLSVFGLLGLVLGPILIVTALALLTSYVDGAALDRTP